MKKQKLLITLLTCICMLFATGCVIQKEVKTMSDFTSSTQVSTVETKDILEEVDNPDVKEAISAYSGNDWKVDFYVMNSEEDAEEFFNTIKEKYENKTGTKTSFTGLNYSQYTYKYLETYSSFGYVENTVYYGYTEFNFKDEINKVINDLGY